MNRNRFWTVLSVALLVSIYTGGYHFKVVIPLTAAVCSLYYLRTHRRSRAARKSKIDNRVYTSHSIPQSLKYRVMQASDGICGICAKPITPDDEMEVDHKIPWSHGGETIMSNLWCVHKECNRKKGNRFENA